VLQSTFMDMVLGLDIHFEMVPMPAPVPTPLPNPFVGMVFDPGGLLTGQAMGLAMALLTGTAPKGPVLVNSMPATTCGTNAKNSLGVPHILMPPGTAWAPMPKLPKPAIKGPPPPPGPPVAPEGDAISVFGSQTVSMMGSSAVRMGDKSMSCGEPVRLPSSTVLAIPKGPPVMTGGPPALSISDAIGALLKSKWIAGYLHDLLSRMSPGRLRNILSWAVCFVTGHPVDVATGRVLTHHVDWELPGELALNFERNYASSWANRAGPLGYGWSHSLDQAVWGERGKLIYLNAEGQELEFDTFDWPDHVLPSGRSVFDPISRSTLTSLGQRRFEIAGPDGVVQEFAPVEGADGKRKWWSRLVRKRAREGATIELEYDRRGNLEWVRDSARREISFEHDGAGHLVAVKLPHPTQHGWQVHTRYAYDEAGDLVAVTDPLGHSWRFAYKQHLLVQETNRNGLSFYFAYDGFGEDAYCVRTWGDGGIYDHVIDYDKMGKATYVTNSLGHTTTYKMNVVGCVVEVMDALGASTKYEYDERTLRKVKETNRVGGETKWEYDARGNITQVIGPDGAEIAIDFNDRDQPVRAVDAVKGEWHWGYDPQGRMVGRIDPLGRRTQFHWRVMGDGRDDQKQDGWRAVAGLSRSAAGPKRLATLTDPSGQETAVGYDAYGNIVWVRTPDGAESRAEYDGLGRCTATIDPKGNASRRARDALGRVVRVDEPDGNVRDLTYDGEGNVLRVRDKHHDLRFAYQGVGRLVSRKEAGSTLAFSYDTEEQLATITNEHGFVYRFERDPVGAVKVEQGFDGRKRRYIRDKARRVVKLSRGDDQLTEYAYDPAGRVVAVKYATGETESYKYRLDGEITEATNDTVTVKLERDVTGRVLREVAGDAWVSSQYDLRNARVLLSSSRGLDERIERDSVSGVVGLRAAVAADREVVALPFPLGSSEPWEARFGRDLGLEIERTLPGGLRVLWERDRIGRLVRQEVSSPTGGVLRAVQYAWDVGNRINMVVDAMRGPSRYEHDAFGNLASTTYAGGSVDVRAPDAVGNLFRSSDRTDRKYGPAGQLLERRRDDGGVVTYEYDLDGNLTKKVETPAASTTSPRTWGYEWNGAGMLSKVARPDGELVEFAYDAFGRRVSKSHAGRTTTWIWDRAVPLHEVVETMTGGQSAEESTTWIFDPETFIPVAKLSDRAAYSIVTDHLGTPAAMYDWAGQEVWTARLDAYGRVKDESGPRNACPFRWPGQYEDVETGLYYNRFRYYDPESGQYTQQDPIRLEGGSRPYAYVPDPQGWIDPLGLVGTIDSNGFFAKSNEYGRGSGSGRTTIPYQGSRSRDFTLANERAGFSSTPENYTWHHANFDPETGLGEMQLVRQDVHSATSHSGGVSEFQDATGLKYDTREAVEHVESEAQLEGRPCG